MKTSKFNFSIFVGPMFAGKTCKLLKTIHYYKKYYHLPKIVLLRSKIDQRSKFSCLKNHNFSVYPVFQITDFTTLKKYWDEQIVHPPIVFISEIQFFPETEIVEIIKFLKHQKVVVMAEGLQKDYLNKPFSFLKLLAPFQPKIIQLYAICELCSAKATTSYRLTKQTELFLLGGKNFYWPLCQSCYDKQHS